ncbi:MAG: hypothetical protein AB1921_09015 [Thermodesulfobacteriota bacterium]
MNEVLFLLAPRYLSVRKSLLSRERGDLVKFALFGVLGLAFWLGIFFLFFKILNYFNVAAVEDQAVGDPNFAKILAVKLLSMVFTTFFALLLFSGVVTTLSKLYLARDLFLVGSLPVSHAKVFLARFLESLVDSSWMIFIYATPVFLSYGMVFHKGLFFYANVFLAMVPFCVSAAALSALVVMLAVLVLPASRFRGILVFLGVSAFVLIYLALRLARPERLVDPDSAASMMRYLASLSTPESLFLPSTWAFDSVREALFGNLSGVLFADALALSGAASLVFLCYWISGAAYFRGVSKAQEGRVSSPGPVALARWRTRRLPFIRGPVRALAAKEIRTFFRDTTQWPQLFLMAALIGIYLYNFKVLPLERSPIGTAYLKNILAFLNMGLATFVLAALSARFVFPAVSLEKEAFWIVRAAPVSMRTFLLIKYAIYFPPLLVLTEILVVATNILLTVTPFLMWVSVITVGLMVPGIVALGLGLGAAYPDFTSENPLQAVTGFGGLLFMILSAIFIATVVMVEAGPVYYISHAGFHHSAPGPLTLLWLGGAGVLVLFCCALAVVLPLRFGLKRLSEGPARNGENAPGSTSRKKD